MTYELDASLALSDLGEGKWQGHTSTGYANRVGPYGGWIAALLMKAILEQRPEGEPLSLTVTFLGGCQDGALTGSTRLLRRSRTNEHWTAEFSDVSGAGVAHAVATFGVRRPTVPIGTIAPPAPAPAALDIPPRPSFGSNGPGFFNRYDVRQFVGRPFKQNESTDSRAWVKDMDARPLDWISLAAHADAPLPRIFLITDKPSAIATMSMSVYFHATPDAFAEAGGDFILVDAECRAGHDGFHDQSARLWTASGRLLATTEQLVWYNAKRDA
ncbi:hypothetical protein sos41_38780 [Alphaproteobacteria bacterium SO-S41]|nr:hypothetical protein sos41_38780 [Alphaproteobacteria bacterium SO-S41]